MKNKFLKTLPLVCAVLTALTLCIGAAHAASFRYFGLTIEIPPGWLLKSDEQVTIYNEKENSAVIVDRLGAAGESDPDSVARNLADGVGIERKNIRRDARGSLSVTFTQDGEDVDVRIFENNGSVMMVYSFGNDPETRKIADSITAGSTKASKKGAAKK